MEKREQLLSAFRENKEFQRKLLGCQEKGQAVSAAMEQVDGITEAEVMDCVKSLIEEANKAQTSFLEDEEVQAVASNGNTVTTATTVTAITAAASSYAFM